jgi:hypothetical protein
MIRRDFKIKKNWEDLDIILCSEGGWHKIGINPYPANVDKMVGSRPC